MSESNEHREPWSARSRDEDRRRGVLDVDVDRPNVARTMNYLLGGGAHFAVDRAAIRAVLALDPRAGARVQAARAFVGRAVRAARDRGHDQFLELGSGIPTAGGLHALVTRGGNPARVAYVDVDAVAVEHTRDQLAREGAPDTAAVQGDLREPARVLADPAITDLLDLARPVTLVCSSVLQWLTGDDDEALAEVFDGYRHRLAPGSLLVVTHPHDDSDAATSAHTTRGVAATLAPLRLRDAKELGRVLGGWELLEPGVVEVVDWPVPSGTGSVGFHGAVALHR